MEVPRGEGPLNASSNNSTFFFEFRGFLSVKRSYRLSGTGGRLTFLNGARRGVKLITGGTLNFLEVLRGEGPLNRGVPLNRTGDYSQNDVSRNDVNSNTTSA